MNIINIWVRCRKQALYCVRPHLVCEVIVQKLLL